MYGVETSESAGAPDRLPPTRDGCMRDLASLHGTWRRVEETTPSLEKLGAFVERLGLARCRWLLDAPVSNSGRLREIRSEVQGVVIDGLVQLGMNDRASPAVRARAEAALRGLLDDLSSPSADAAETLMAAKISRYLNRAATDEMAAQPPPDIPPGSPIGDWSASAGRHDECSMAAGFWTAGGSH